MINYNQARNGMPFTAEEMAAAEAQCNKASTDCPNNDTKLVNTNTNKNGATAMTNQYQSQETIDAMTEVQYQAQLEEEAMNQYDYDNEFACEEEGLSMADLAAFDNDVEDVVIYDDEVSVQTEIAANAGTENLTIEVKSMTNPTQYTKSIIITDTMTPEQISSAKAFFSNGMVVDFANGTINGRLVRNYGIIRETKWVKGKQVIDRETLVTSNVLLNLVARYGVANTSSANEAQSLVFEILEQALFVEQSGYGRPERLSELPTRDEVLNANTAYVFHRTDRGIRQVDLDAKTMQRLINTTDLAVTCDKQVSKAVHVGAGANAASVYRNGNTMTSINPINDYTKGLNRTKAGFSGKADSDERVVADLIFRGEETDFVAEGIKRRVIFAPGLAVLAQGMVAVNDGVSFDFYSHKQLSLRFAVETIGEQITETNYVNGDIIGYGREITINDIVIYRHEDNTDLQLESFKATRDGGVWCFDIATTMTALSKTNIKVRDFGCKGMTHNNGTVVVGNTEWDLLFTSESMKTSEGIRTMYTEANPGHEVDVDGILRDVNGNEVTTEVMQAWFMANGESMTIKTPVHYTNVPFIKPAVGEKVTFSAPDANGIVIATQTTFAICADYLFNIEMASADEVAGYRTKIDATSNTIQSLISDKYAKQINRITRKNARKLSILNFVPGNNRADFDPTAKLLPIKAAASRVMALIAEHGNVRDALSAICSAGVDSFKVTFNARNNDWLVTVPVKAFLAFGQFDVVGNAALSASSVNPIDLAIRFLALVESGADSEALRSFVLDNSVRNEIERFVENKTNSVVAKALRGPSAFYSKAIADWRIPYMAPVAGANVPVVYVAPESPVFNCEDHKLMAENEFVVVNRTPMPVSVVAALQTTKFAMDANVIGINPLIMDVNHGDNDGDAIAITAPRLIGAPVSAEQAIAFNNSVVSIGGYHADLARKGELSTTITEIAKVCKPSFADKISRKFFTAESKVTAELWASEVAKVHKVYAEHVAQSYDIAFAALQEFAARVAAGDTTFDADVMLADAMDAWTRYEDKALCGYNADTYAEMNEYLSGKGMTPFVTAVYFGMEQAKEDYKESSAPVEADSFATTAFAIRLAGKKFKSAKIADATKRRAYLAAAVSSGKITKSTPAIYNVAKAVNAPYSAE